RPRTRLALSPSKVSVSASVSALLESMRDPTVVPLGGGAFDPEMLPIRALNRTLAGLARELGTAGAAYDMPPGMTSLRRQLARRSVHWGCALAEDDFVTTVGAMEALHLALRATTRPGDTVAVASPTYFGLLQLVEELGLRAIEVPAHPRTGLDLDALDTVLKEARISACLAMTTFDNPLGSLMSDEAKERLVRTLERHDVPLVEDDIYGELGFDGRRPRPAKAFDRKGHVLLCGSVSKTLAAGYRVGWIVPGRYREKVERLKFATTVATPTLLQMAVAEYLANGGYDRHLRTLRAHIAGEVRRYRQAVAGAFPEGTVVSEPLGGYVLWVELPGDIDAMELQARALERGVAIAPGPIFSARRRFASCVRVSCIRRMGPEVTNALATVGELAVKMARRRG
ncbi:MAG TPA: PLP-dependent aminotransferase family protein, partial [Polyangiaceae bacterium]|nr:PLP-dependent aminotransferase family protein [Polyangiaceae bacterium]